MGAAVKQYLKYILALILTVQVVCLCCVFSACTPASATESAPASVPAPSDPVENYSRWLNAHCSASVATRGEWLRDLLTYTPAGEDAGESHSDAELFLAAYEASIIDSADCTPYTALTRGYAAATLMRAMRYEPVTVVEVADEDADEAMLTLVYFGYFVPDEENRVYPEATVTHEEYTALTAELQRAALLRGKTILSFGDSIMFGVGNKGEGISDVIADKYGMTSVDYSMCRATLGVNGENSHIPDQLRAAAAASETADLILLNGGTNDMLHVPCGVMNPDSDETVFIEDTFAGGLETCFRLLRQYWDGVPVIFIRAHNMDICDDAVERFYGEYALTIAEKWSVPTADIYESFNAEDPDVRDRYTFYKEQIERTDSIHPTPSGYAKYYLPKVSAIIEELLTQ